MQASGSTEWPLYPRRALKAALEGKVPGQGGLEVLKRE